MGIGDWGLAQSQKTVSGVNIFLSASAGVLLENAYFNATEIDGTEDLKQMEESIGAELSGSKKVTDIKAFDIIIYDEEGNEIQPNTSKGNVQVTFKNADIVDSIADSDIAVEVYHMSDSLVTAEAVNSSAGGDEVSFDGEHFSPFAVVAVISIEDHEADNTKEIDEKALIKSVKIYKLDDSGNESELTNGSDNVISKDDTIRVKYAFKNMSLTIPGTEDDAPFDYVYPNKSYRIPGIPANFVRANGNSLKMTNGTTDLGEITFDTEGKAILTISNFYDLLDEAKNANAGFDLKLNLSDSGDSNKSCYELS